MDSTYNIVLSTSESTVVTEYVPEKKRSEVYQSEAALEDAFGISTSIYVHAVVNQLLEIQVKYFLCVVNGIQLNI